jgi:ketosteroid isomerase-like protein
MSEENVELIRNGYERYAAGDIEGVAELVADDAELAGAGGLGIADTAAETRYGPEGFVRAAEEALEAFDEYRVEAEEFIDAGNAVVVPVLISGRGRASGAKLEVRLAHLWVLRDGKVIRGTVHRTTEEALEAARSEQ